MSRLLLFLLMLLVGTPAWAMEHYTQPLQDQEGRAIRNASVRVYLAGTTTLATIYSDNGITAKSNPFSTTSTGLISFYAASGVYDLVFTKQGYTFNSSDTARIAMFDITDGGGGGGGGVASFDGIGSGTNTTAAMIVGSGASLSVSGTGTISANRYNGSSTIGLGDGGTNQTSWTASRCVHVNSAGTALEVMGGDCSISDGFDSIMTGTNTTATMTVGGGSTLTWASTGIVNANRWFGNVVIPVSTGGTNLITAADDATMVGNGTTWQSKSLPSCSNSTTSKLLYDTATNSFSCGTDQNASSPTFDTIGAGTNTTAAMVIGTGSSLALTGSGSAEASIFKGSGTTSNAVDLGTAEVAGILAAANGGTANGFTAFSGPTSSTKTFTLPNASATLLTTNSLVSLAQGGTNANSWTAAKCVRVNAGGTALESAASDCAAAPTFDTVTSGTNTSATMTLGTGSSLTFSGTGTVNANRFNGNATIAMANGGTGLGTSPDDNVMVGNGTAWQLKSLPACSTNGTDKLLYNASTNAFSCGSDQGATPTFDTITSGTNTVAAMVIDTGASLTYANSGSINASTYKGNATVAVADGGTGLTAGGDDTVLVGSAATTYVATAVPSCSNATTSKLLYNTSTNAFSCGTDQSAGTSSFDLIGSGTNTTSAMVVDTGATLLPSGTGVISNTASAPNITTAATSYTILSTDFEVLCDTTAAARVLTLPSAATKAYFRIKNIGANTCTINRAGADLIDGATSAVLRTQYEAVDLVADASTNWEVH